MRIDGSVVSWAALSRGWNVSSLYAQHNFWGEVCSYVAYLVRGGEQRKLTGATWNDVLKQVEAL